MSETEPQMRQHQELSPPRSANGRTPPGYRVLHVLLPETTFNNVKAMAYLSGMRFQDYVAKFLAEVCPYSVDRKPQIRTSTPAPESFADDAGHPW
jgi:hypothetical protein